MARSAGLMLAKKPANLGERFFFRIIEAESLFFLRLELFERRAERLAEKRQVARAMRIDQLERSRRRPLARLVMIVFSKLLEAPARADGINVSLGQDRAEPGPERASPVKVAKQGPLRAFAAREAIQLREQGIGELTGFRRSGIAAKNR